ncbi:hypothetical protein COT78_02235 [Candidatus Berkelbacteria bacterium CG10_big_fil_rev_8_21_14_0_10_43_13]|uniref:Uncharacterized protein n=1 Tax=Candidatus Berkelbacteria bacterium CG10_big_fil_rev_8_21_14_0_10_43_13 TaxID=1974514 RepID=A0A2H0W6F6_9BACT|nr:MAG: hypothetical protein COT78_02235 [Candidatus Berkelbacteria bacterium CG10_big_fil_rev_8_21_14_0_10_43_13]
MTITILVIAYALFVIAFLIFSLIGNYHLRRFGYAGDLTKPVILFYTVVSTAVIIATILAIIYKSFGA